MRTILHLDMNSYFATVEQQSNPFLRGKPICVAGKGSGERTICAAASIEAKKYGVKSGFGIWEAKKLCPNILVVQADYSKYQFISQKIFSIMESYTPLVEVFSIDEAFMDVTQVTTDTSKVSVRMIAEKIKARIQEEIGDYLKCSIGIASNKLLAKLASEMVKPDGLTLIRSQDIDKILAKTPIEDLCGVGRRLKIRLNNIGIQTAKDLGDFPEKSLIKLFGPHLGTLLHNMGKGQDDSPVLPYYQVPEEKSFGHSYTLPKDIMALQDAKKVLLKLSEKVGRRMRQKGFMGKTLHFYLRFFDFSGYGQRVTLSIYINDGFAIYRVAEGLLERYKAIKPIRMIGVSVSNVLHTNQISLPLLDEDIRKEKVLRTLDKINDKFGEFTVFRGALVEIKDRIENIPDGRNKRMMELGF